MEVNKFENLLIICRLRAKIVHSAQNWQIAVLLKNHRLAGKPWGSTGQTALCRWLQSVDDNPKITRDKKWKEKINTQAVSRATEFKKIGWMAEAVKKIKWHTVKIRSKHKHWGKMVDKAGANKAKNAGNIAFKAKDFDTAISSYNTAIELDPDEVRDIVKTLLSQ